MEFYPQGIIFDYKEIEDRVLMRSLSVARQAFYIPSGAPVSEEIIEVIEARERTISAAEDLGRMHAAQALAGVSCEVASDQRSYSLPWQFRLGEALKGSAYDHRLRYFVLRNDEIPEVTELLSDFRDTPATTHNETEDRENAGKLLEAVSSRKATA